MDCFISPFLARIPSRKLSSRCNFLPCIGDSTVNSMISVANSALDNNVFVAFLIEEWGILEDDDED